MYYRLTRRLIWVAAILDTAIIAALGTALYFTVTEPTGIVATTIRSWLPW